MRLIFLTAVMLAAAPLSALADGCSTYDYAELKEMSLTELHKVKYDLVVQSFLAMDVRRPNQAGDDLCDSEKAKVDRMIAKRETEVTAPAATEAKPDQATADGQPPKPN